MAADNRISGAGRGSVRRGIVGRDAEEGRRGAANAQADDRDQVTTRSRCFGSSRFLRPSRQPPLGVPPVLSETTCSKFAEISPRRFTPLHAASHRSTPLHAAPRHCTPLPAAPYRSIPLRAPIGWHSVRRGRRKRPSGSESPVSARATRFEWRSSSRARFGRISCGKVVAVPDTSPVGGRRSTLVDHRSSRPAGARGDESGTVATK